LKQGETVIISTGALTAKILGIPSEQKLRGGRISACAVCEVSFTKDRMSHCWGGDTAAEERLIGQYC